MCPEARCQCGQERQFRYQDFLSTLLSMEYWVWNRNLPKEYPKEEESQLLVSLLLTLKATQVTEIWTIHSLVR